MDWHWPTTWIFDFATTVGLTFESTEANCCENVFVCLAR
ncbi:hypothetical protein SynPROS91_01543 [Synechococcus sp. PROS-9-1]|nr:hypothetical protein SynPROS91_01543 [Synechococcus sp. PROS-9-1]